MGQIHGTAFFFFPGQKKTQVTRKSSVIRNKGTNTTPLGGTMKNTLFVLSAAFATSCSSSEQETFIAENANNPATRERINNTVISMALESASLLPKCELALAGQLVWLINEQEFRTCNYKTLVWDVVSIIGSKGDTGIKGLDGLDGANCTVAQVTGGANVTCGNNTVFIANGTNGTNGIDGINGVDGQDGASCVVTRGVYGTIFTCGASEVFAPDNRLSVYRDDLDFPNRCPNSTGYSLHFYYDLNRNYMFDNDDEPSESMFVCNGDAGAQGIAGTDGSNCSVTGATGGANITCGNDTVFIANGTNASAAPIPVMYRNGVKVGPILAISKHEVITGTVYQVQVEGTPYIVNYSLSRAQGALQPASYFAASTYTSWAAQNADEYYEHNAKRESFVNLAYSYAGSPAMDSWYEFNPNKIVSYANQVWVNSPTVSVTGYGFVWNRVAMTEAKITALRGLEPSEIRYE
jgi:hypothetical protein